MQKKKKQLMRLNMLKCHILHENDVAHLDASKFEMSCARGLHFKEQPNVYMPFGLTSHPYKEKWD